MHHEAIRRGKVCSGLLTFPALPGPHHILRAAAGHLQWDTGSESCIPALILWWDLEGEAFHLSGPWFLLQEWMVCNLIGNVTPFTLKKPHIWVSSAKLLSHSCSVLNNSQSCVGFKPVKLGLI